MKNSTVQHDKKYVMNYSQVKINNAMDNVKLTNIHYTNCIFNDLRLKFATIENSTITQSVIENNYLRHATFKNCSFVGTQFSGCNLEKATFINCNFEYAKFSDCLLNIDNLMKTSFNNYNQKSDFLYQLYKNELSVGRNSNADKLFIQYKINKIAFYKICLTTYFKCQDNTSSYYIDETKRIGFYKILKNYLYNTMFRILFGFGIRFRTIFFSFTVVTFLFALLYWFLLYEKDNSLLNNVLLSLENIILSNISYSKIPSYPIAVILIEYFENLVGIVYLSILTASVYGRISK